MNPAPFLNSKMYHVYLLRSLKNKSFYVGYTTDIQKRVNEHNKGLSGYTRKYLPWRLVYRETFISLDDAKRREKSLKYFGKSFTYLKSRLEDSLKKIE